MDRASASRHRAFAPRRNWLPGLIARGHVIYRGFDTDEAGETVASQMIALYLPVRRLRLPAPNWNDALAAAAESATSRPPDVRGEQVVIHKPPGRRP